MKKHLIMTVLLLLCSFTSFGQTISFKDVPLEGNTQELKIQLQLKYPSDIQYQDKNGMMLKGTYLNCPALYIIHFGESENVGVVDIKFKQCYSWTSLEDNFNSVKERLINEYGKPVYEVYNFTNEHSAFTDYERAVRNECLYSAEFKSNQNGHYIRIFIKGFSDRTASVVIRHTKGQWSKQNLGSIINDLGSNCAEKPQDGYTISSTAKITGAFGSGSSMGVKKTGGYGTFELQGRSLGPSGLPIPVYSVQDEGRVVVSIVVNPAGRVISTSINKRTNTVNASLRRAAEEAARKARFNVVDGINNQSGTITYYFKLK